VYIYIHSKILYYCSNNVILFIIKVSKLPVQHVNIGAETELLNVPVQYVNIVAETELLNVPVKPVRFLVIDIFEVIIVCYCNVAIDIFLLDIFLGIHFFRYTFF